MKNTIIIFILLSSFYSMSGQEICSESDSISIYQIVVMDIPTKRARVYNFTKIDSNWFYGFGEYRDGVKCFRNIDSLENSSEIDKCFKKLKRKIKRISKENYENVIITDSLSSMNISKYNIGGCYIRNSCTIKEVGPLKDMIKDNSSIILLKYDFKMFRLEKLDDDEKKTLIKLFKLYR